MEIEDIFGWYFVILGGMTIITLLGAVVIIFREIFK